MLKKSVACLLVLLLCVCAVSCAKGDDSTPEGMQSATLSGEPFVLYVPTSWTLNTASGISSAYYSSSEKILVSARYYTPDREDMTVEEYLTFCDDTYRQTLADYESEELAPALLGTRDAQKLSYTMTESEKTMVCFQITTLYDGNLVSLYGYCSEGMWANCAADFDWIQKEFVLCEVTDPQGEVVTDKHTPEGMEIASSDNVEYRLYVPETWICDAASGKSEAYYPESQRSNVSVTSFAPENSISVENYFVQCETEYKKSVPGYERIGEAQERTVAERTAYSYTYRAVVEDQPFTVMQTLFAYNGMIYSFTYTAREEQFETHLEDVEAMLDAFTFR